MYLFYALDSQTFVILTFFISPPYTCFFMSREMIYFVDIIIIEKVMLYVIAIVNLLLGCFTFAYLFAETDPVADYLYAAMQGSIVLNILSIALLWKGWKNYSHNKKNHCYGPLVSWRFRIVVPNPLHTAYYGFVMALTHVFLMNPEYCCISQPSSI